jgi:hypothetical protein
MMQTYQNWITYSPLPLKIGVMLISTSTVNTLSFNILMINIYVSILAGQFFSLAMFVANL